MYCAKLNGLRPKDQERQIKDHQPAASGRPTWTWRRRVTRGGKCASHGFAGSQHYPPRLHDATTKSPPLAPTPPPLLGGLAPRHTRHQLPNGFQPFGRGRPTIRVKKRSSRNSSHGYAGSLVPGRPIYPDWSGSMLCEAAMALRPLRWAHPREGPLGWRLFHSRTNGCFQNGNNHYSVATLF